ncbi:MAG: DUF192 domain-containing protein [Bryobacterales bacterium]|nr:DUF192 domain-containing protein [Bryobacterales bacterium]
MPRLALIAMIGWIWMTGCNRQGSSGDAISLKPVTLPGGQQVMAEVMLRPEDMMRGMMYRSSLAPDRGLLFVHGRPGKYTYWMHNVRVPLDIIWMDSGRRIVEMSLNTPPCLEQDPVKCPQYGGKEDAQFVLELAGGMAAKYGLAVGQIVSF